MKYQRFLFLVIGYVVTNFALATPALAAGVSGQITFLGKCLEVGYGNAIQRHDVAHLADCNGSAAQQFTFQSDNSIKVGGFCLDVPNSYAVDHQVVQAFDCRNQLNQHFVEDNQHHLSVQGLCLDVPNADGYDGANMQLFNCRHQDNQAYTFVQHS